MTPDGHYEGCYCVEKECLRKIGATDADFEAFLTRGLCPACLARGAEGVPLPAKLKSAEERHWARKRGVPFWRQTMWRESWRWSAGGPAEGYAAPAHMDVDEFTPEALEESVALYQAAGWNRDGKPVQVTPRLDDMTRRLLESVTPPAPEAP